MSSKIIKYVVLAAVLVATVSAIRIVPSVSAQQSASTAVEALQKARVLGSARRGDAGGAQRDSRRALCSILRGPSRCRTTG